MSHLTVLLWVTLTPARAAYQPMSRGECRAVAHVAQSLWPQVPAAQLREWSKTQARVERRSYDPDAFAARLVALVNDELIEREAQRAPDPARLTAAIEVLFDAAHVFAGGPLSEEQRDLRGNVHRVQAAVVAAGAALSLGSFAILNATPSADAILGEIIFCSIPTVATLVFAHLSGARMNLPPGTSYATSSRMYLIGQEQLRASLAARLANLSTWRRARLRGANDAIARDPAALLRFVWSPGTVRKSCEYWLQAKV